MIDLYCERVAPGLLGEPLNALSNLAFVVAAWLAWRYAARMSALSADVRLLSILMAAIGIGSALFHTFATRWAMLLDILPIFVFQLAYLWVYCGSVIGMPRRVRWFAVVALFIAVAASLPLAGHLNGSPIYVPALVTLVLLALWHRRHVVHEPLRLTWAAALFMLSLTARTADQALCTSWPAGTHFAWHLLNGAVLFFAITALITARGPSHTGVNARHPT